MSAREQAFKDIKLELDTLANSEHIERKLEGKRWLPYADCYSYADCTYFAMRITHLINYKSFTF